MILYGFMVRYGENNRWGPGRPPPVVFRQNERPWLLGLKGSHTFWNFPAMWVIVLHWAATTMITQRFLWSHTFSHILKTQFSSRLHLNPYTETPTRGSSVDTRSLFQRDWAEKKHYPRNVFIEKSGAPIEIWKRLNWHPARKLCIHFVGCHDLCDDLWNRWGK